MTDLDDQVPLFEVAELALDTGRAGRVEAALHVALTGAQASGAVTAVDAGLAAGALVAARALDGAERIASPKDRAYAVTALLPPFQRALHGLRLPAEVQAATEPPEPATPAAGSSAPDWMSDLGTPQ